MFANMCSDRARWCSKGVAEKESLSHKSTTTLSGGRVLLTATVHWCACLKNLNDRVWSYLLVPVGLTPRATLQKFDHWVFWRHLDLRKTCCNLLLAFFTTKTWYSGLFFPSPSLWFPSLEHGLCKFTRNSHFLSSVFKLWCSYDDVLLQDLLLFAKFSLQPCETSQ